MRRYELCSENLSIMWNKLAFEQFLKPIILRFPETLQPTSSVVVNFS
jgi:hypothetical protein